MADAVSVLDQFIEKVNRVAVADFVRPVRPTADSHESQCDIFIEKRSQAESSITDPSNWSISEIQDSFVSGDLTPGALVDRLWQHIDFAEPLIQGWVSFASDLKNQASDCDLQISSGVIDKPLLGIPMGIKDLIDVAGLPTLCGSRQTLNIPVENDAPVIARLREAGAIIMGKTTTHEYAFGGTTPPTRNPWNLNTVPGGSSGGSGAVLGAGMVPGALGTDTAGSVRIPAAYCGAVGFMGSTGWVPTNNVAVLAWSLDHVGAMARNVADTARIQRVLAGLPFSNTSPSARLPEVIGIPKAVLEPMHPAVHRAFDSAVSAIESRGVKIVDVPWPDPDLLEAVGFILMMAESAAFHRDRMKTPELFDPQVAELLESGATVSAVDHIQALRVKSQLAEWFDALMSATPFIVTPTLPCLPPPLGSDTFTPLDLGTQTQPLATAHTRFTLAANIADLPAGSLPCGLSEGFPIGLQIMGRGGSDLGVLDVMAGVEEVLAQAKLWNPGSVASQFGGING
jgi:aspartyl-tRNA(Asn)/glutamyl-tRNA(Gln) amidotransferase subunit A